MAFSKQCESLSPQTIDFEERDRQVPMPMLLDGLVELSLTDLTDRPLSDDVSSFTAVHVTAGGSQGS